MSKNISFGLLGLLLLGRLVTAVEPTVTAAPQFRPGVLFTGTDLPRPPQQGEPWQPPGSKLTEKWVAAVQELARYGLADPRGCEYREVSVTCGSVWGGTGALVTAHAWVIPAAKDAAHRFTVTWDGQVYPIVDLGPPAGLKADVESLLKQDDKWWQETVARSEEQKKEHPTMSATAFQPYRWSRAWEESHLISHNSMHPLKCVMLFLLGEGDLAERVWTAWSRGSSAQTDRGAPADDPYLLLVREWGWAQYNRAVCAHMRGDDMLCLLTAQALLAWTDNAQQAAAQRGFPQPHDFNSTSGRSGAQIQTLPYVQFDDPPQRLLEDATRRVKEGRVMRVLEAGIDKFPDQPQRIAALVRDLEVVDERQWSQPGGVQISQSPIVQALVKEGPPAVESLLECLANDQRLTRSVSFGRDFAPQRYFISVRSAAYAALRGILKAESFGPKSERGYRGQSDAEQREIVAEIRAYWQKNQGLPPEEVCYRTLADFVATSAQWVEAAERLVSRVPREEIEKGWQARNAMDYNGHLRIPETDEDLARPPAGEALRASKKPSVTELLTQRADEMAKLSRLKQSDYDMATACELTLLLVRWDRQAAAPVSQRDWGVVDGATTIRGEMSDLLGKKPGSCFSALYPVGDGTQVVAAFHLGSAAVFGVENGHIVRLGDAPVKAVEEPSVYSLTTTRTDSQGQVWIMSSRDAPGLGLLRSFSYGLNAQGHLIAKRAGWLRLEDRRHGLWFAQTTRGVSSLVRLDAGGKETTLQLPNLTAAMSLAEAPDGSVWTLTCTELIRIRAEAEALVVVDRYPLNVADSDRLWCECDGHLWMFRRMETTRFATTR